jgi:hypothetical protein
MNYRIRGLLEENLDYLLDASAEVVAANQAFWNLPDEVKHELVFEVAYHRLGGFHQMWSSIEGNEPEDDCGEVLYDMVDENIDGLIYKLDEYESKYRKKYNNESEVPTYDIE